MLFLTASFEYTFYIVSMMGMLGSPPTYVLTADEEDFLLKTGPIPNISECLETVLAFIAGGC